MKHIIVFNWIFNICGTVIMFYLPMQNLARAYHFGKQSGLVWQSLQSSECIRLPKVLKENMDTKNQLLKILMLICFANKKGLPKLIFLNIYKKISSFGRFSTSKVNFENQI